MDSIKIGSVVEVSIEEGHVLFDYHLKVTSIDETYTDDEGNFCCVAYGEGVTEEDKELVEEFTCRIDDQNFIRVVS